MPQNAETAVRPVLRFPGRLTLTALEAAAGPIEVNVDDDARRRVEDCREFVLDQHAAGTPIYGVTTGFGPMVAFAGRSELADQADNLLSHLTAGQGPDLAPEVVRATLLVRLWSLSQGRSGVSLGVIDALRAMLCTDFAPVVPRLGSVGASGDLVPLTHAAQALRGNGFAYVGASRMPAGDALFEAGLTPLALDGRDALGFVNGTSLAAAAGGLALAAVARSHLVAQILSATMADLLGCGLGYLSENLLTAFGHRHTMSVGRRMRELLTGAEPTGTRGLQEPYSIRCTPQLLGAVGSSLEHVRSVVMADLNGISDNPVFIPEEGEVAHGGNFFGQPVSFVADLLTNTATQMGNLAERQLDLMIDPNRNGGLPPMLATEPGKQHGVQGVQIAATATVADMRRNAVPASVQSLPTNGHNQDVVPFGSQAALNALDQARKLRWLHGSLAVALRQAVHVGPRRPVAPSCAAVMDTLVDLVPPIDPDRPLDTDVRRAADEMDAVADELLGADLN
jgi:histidine ammonia-lyase